MFSFAKCAIFVQMFDFCQNVGFFTKWFFFRKMCSFCQNVLFWSKWAFLSSCCQNVHFFVTICAFYVKLFQNFVFPIFEFPKFPIFVLPKFVPPYICSSYICASYIWSFLGPVLPVKWGGTLISQLETGNSNGKQEEFLFKDTNHIF